MLQYSFKRILLIIPTLLGIMLINFAIIQVVPGGPVEKLMAQISGHDVGSTSRFSDIGSEISQPVGDSSYRGSRGLDPELVERIEKLYGFDKPAYERFLHMLGNYMRFDFGTSFYSDKPVVDLVLEKMPVSISLGLWTTLLVYLISIPLGIKKAVRDGTKFDIYSSYIIIIGYAIPSFLFAVLLLVVFAGGEYWSIFPLRGLVSDNWSELSAFGKITDYLWHITLPVIAMTIGGFASLTMLCKNSFLDEISKQYVTTARAKGLDENGVLYGHVFRNAMLIVIAGFPSAFAGILFTGSLLIEVIFSLDGLGLLGFEAAVNRDYPIVMATLFFFTLLGLILNLIGDLVYILVDPRIDFEKAGV